MKNVYAVIVTYFPESNFINNILETAKQVDKVVVVDNASDSSTQQSLLSLSKHNPNIEVVLQTKNLGIDKATNIGIKKHKDHYDWVLTLDQDSTLGENMVSQMLKIYNTELIKQNIKVGELSPLSQNYNEINQSSNDSFNIVDLVNSSGRLIPTKVFREIGYHDERFFIDGSDWEFTYRLREAGFKSVQINSAILHHQLGENKEYTFFGKKIKSDGHSPLRRYYMVRNYLLLASMYWKKYPKLIKKSLMYLLKENTKSFIYEPNRFAYLNAVLQGIKDFMLKKYGEKS